MNAVLKKELHTYFSTPVGYIFMAAVMLLSGLAFRDIFAMGLPEISYVFGSMFMFYMLLIPILTMKLMSDERRLKTDQILLTAPVGLPGIVMGKFFAAFAVFALSLSINLVYATVMAVFSAPDWMVFAGNMLGALLLGAAVIAIGLFVSSLTESQLSAAVITLAVSSSLLLLDVFADYNTSTAFGRFINKIIGWISMQSRYNAFTQGIIDYSNIVFFIGVAAIFIFLTVRVLESKRWS